MAKHRNHAAPGADPLVFVHVGDLHLEGGTDRNAEDFRAILEQIDEVRPRDTFDFVYLPGDLAENGLASEYAVLEAALSAHPNLPIRLIPGDHDRQYDRMDDFRAFHAASGAKLRRPKTWTLEQPPTGPGPWPTAAVEHYCFWEEFQGVRCLFLDMVSPGYGRKAVGLDFRLGPKQTDWLDRKLTDASKAGTPCAVFMHAYPDDLREPDDRLDVAGLIRAADVRVVEMGHTHYNELAYDGRTLYAAARSVGQNEDGSVGYAVVAIDGPVTAWRFKALDRKWPFVLITSPADRRLASLPACRETSGTDMDGHDRITVRAVVLSDEPPDYVHCRAGTGRWIRMTSTGGRCYEVALPWRGDERTIQVEAVHRRWPHHGPDFVDTDVIEPVTVFAEPGARPPSMPEKPGSDAFRILPAWPQKGLRGDQLGPNRNGRKW